MFLWLDQLLDLEQQQAVLKRNLEKCIRERDSIRQALEEERLLRESDDAEMRKRLKVSYGGFCLT